MADTMIDRATQAVIDQINEYDPGRNYPRQAAADIVRAVLSVIDLPPTTISGAETCKPVEMHPTETAGQYVSGPIGNGWIGPLIFKGALA